jgi:hypothetical protein
MPIEQPTMQIATNDAQVSPTMPLMCEQFMREEQGLLLGNAPGAHFFLLEKFLHTSPVEQGAFCQLPIFSHRTRYLRDLRCRRCEDMYSAAHKRGPALPP